MNNEIIYSTSPEDFSYIAINVPCQSACPTATNIPAYIRSVFEEKYGRSYEINRSQNILPGVLGRVCSRPCEQKCRHGEAELGEPVNICYLKRAAADYRSRKSNDNISIPAISDKNIAIVGAGPSGLAAANDLVTLGFSVTIFDAFDKPGGMLRYGIPEFRLPRDILEDEIADIIRMGVNLRTGIRVGKDLKVEELLTDFDAVLIAIGCYKALSLDIPGEALPGVYSGLKFMMDINAGKPVPLGDRLLIIGAGFTAFDCARSAMRIGVRDINICLRRTLEDLVVTESEVHETLLEGIKIESLMLANRVLGKDKVEGVEFLRNRPGELGPDNKRSISAIKGSEFSIPADNVIIATGQAPDVFVGPGIENKPRTLKSDNGSFTTSLPGLYVTGDYLTGSSTVIQAIASGRKAAEKITLDLCGESYRKAIVRMENTTNTDRERTWDFIPAQNMPTINPVVNRFKAPDVEVETGYPLDLAKAESKRCYLCYLHYEIDIGRCIYCRYCIDVAPRDCIKLVQDLLVDQTGAISGFVETSRWKDVNAIMIDNSRCIRCGACVKICPVNCISVTKVELTEQFTGQGGTND